MANYIGVDVGKKSLHGYIRCIEGFVEVNNDEKGFAKLISIISKNYKLAEVIIAFEPTGGYEQLFREFLKSNKIHFTIVHPNKVRSYAKAKGLLAKTDRVDSKLIADYALAFSLPVKEDYNTQSMQHLHALIQRREQLVKLKNQESNRLEAEYNESVITSIKEHIDHLSKQLSIIESAIKDTCDNDEMIQNKIKSLTSIPGVGITLATKAITQVPELGNIECGKLTSLVGLAPFARDSGSYKGKRSIFAGKGKLRKVLYMAAVASLRCNIKLKRFYDRLISNHKPPKLALVAVMRKLLSFMNAILKNNSYWNVNYENCDL
jgi:transposase